MAQMPFFFFFFFFCLRRLLHPLYICQQISVRGASVIDYTQPCCFFCFASLWNVLSILHLYLHPRCSCHFYFQNLWFFVRNPLDGQILQCPHDEGRLLLKRAMQYNVLHYSSDPAVNDVQRVFVSVSPSVLSKTPTSMNAIWSRVCRTVVGSPFDKM